MHTLQNSLDYTLSHPFLIFQLHFLPSCVLTSWTFTVMSNGPCSALQPGVHWLFTQKSQGHGMQTEVKFERWWGLGPSFPKRESLPTYWVEVVGLGPLKLQPNFPFSLSKNRRTLRNMTYLSFSLLSSTYTFLSNMVCSWSLPPLALPSRTASIMNNSWSWQEQNSTTWKVLGEDRSGWLRVQSRQVHVLMIPPL